MKLRYLGKGTIRLTPLDLVIRTGDVVEGSTAIMFMNRPGFEEVVEPKPKRAKKKSKKTPSVDELTVSHEMGLYGLEDKE